MNKKYLGVIISLLGLLGLIILNGLTKLYGIVANYDALSFFDIIYDNFLLSYITLMILILLGLYFIIKEYNKELFK